MGAITLQSGIYGNYYSGNNWLTSEQMETNAGYLYRFLTARGWHVASIAGVMGNLAHESKANPGIWEQLDDAYPCYVSYPWNDNSPAGAGLVQWTPACDRLLPWAVARGVPWQSMDFQLDELDHEMTYNQDGDGYGVFFGAVTDGMTALEFKTNARNKTAYELAIIFLNGYERPANPNNDERGQSGEYWYQWFIVNGGSVGIIPAWPTLDTAEITSQFGNRIDPISGESQFHYGLDLASGLDSPIYAVMGGIVIEAGYNNLAGNFVLIRHTDDDKYSRYLHLNSSSVVVGSEVTRGQQIGGMGTTGYSTGVHLHIEISSAYPFQYNAPGSLIDPELYLTRTITPPSGAMYPPKKFNFVVFAGRPVHIR